MIVYLKSMFLLFALFSFGVSRADNVKPEIELLSPVDGTEVVRGNSLRVCAILSDNIALNDYQISIIKGGSEDLRYVTSFSYNHLTNACVDASGKPPLIIRNEQKLRIDFYIGIAKDAIVGDYYFLLLVQDKAGNEQLIKRCFNVVQY